MSSSITNNSLDSSL